jgi:hypothetical protein
MRDLAQQFGENRGNLRVKNLWRLLVILVLVGVGFFLIKNRFENVGSSGSSIILQEAPYGLVPVEVGNIQITSEGVNLTTQQASFRDVKYGGEASARATRSFGGGAYILSVDATLPDPKNVNYQVWLVGDDGVVPIDYMTGSKNGWSLRLRSSDKYSKYDGIWITLERSKDETSEEHVLEGSF